MQQQRQQQTNVVWNATPLLALVTSAVTPIPPGVRVYLKLENTQQSGSFKLRGIGHFCSKAKQRQVAGLVSSSGGNAGVACAFACHELNIPLTVFVPLSTPVHVIQLMQQLNADVIRLGTQWSEAHQAALHWLTEHAGYELVHPYDHPDIWEGHASIVKELATQLPEGGPPDAIVLSVGGGGLYNGVVQGLIHQQWTAHTKVITVETHGADCLYLSRAAGHRVTLAEITSVASTLGASCVSERTWELVQSHPTLSYTVSDANAVEAVDLFLRDHRMLVEPSCGATLSAVYHGIIQALVTDRSLKPDAVIVLIVCGGVGVSMESLHKWKSQFSLL